MFDPVADNGGVHLQHHSRACAAIAAECSVFRPSFRTAKGGETTPEEEVDKDLLSASTLCLYVFHPCPHFFYALVPQAREKVAQGRENGEEQGSRVAQVTGFKTALFSVFLGARRIPISACFPAALRTFALTSVRPLVAVLFYSVLKSVLCG
ncbi:hypothetical protein MRX96_015429 [Rhipicephalus microplus]